MVVCGACGSGDTAAPASPRVDLVATPTSLPTQLITGTAEFGATVEIAGLAVTPAPVSADPYTARFATLVDLAVGDNILASRRAMLPGTSAPQPP